MVILPIPVRLRSDLIAAYTMSCNTHQPPRQLKYLRKTIRIRFTTLCQMVEMTQNRVLDLLWPVFLSCVPWLRVGQIAQLND